MSGFRGLARAPRLLGFGLLVGFSGALLVVSALDMVCDCHLGRFCGPGVVVGGSCGAYWSLLAWGWPFPGCWGRGGGLWAVSKVESSARAPRLPRFIQLVSFIDTLLVVWTLDIVYDCHLRPLLQS